MRAISIIGALAASLCLTSFAKASGEHEYVSDPAYQTVFAQPVQQGGTYYAPAYQPAPVETVSTYQAYDEPVYVAPATSTYYVPTQAQVIAKPVCPSQAELANLDPVEAERRLADCPTDTFYSEEVEMEMRQVPVRVKRQKREIVYIKGDTEYVDRPVHIKGDTEYVPAPVLQCSQIAIAAGCSCSDTAQGPIQNCETTIVEPAPVVPSMMSMPSGPSFVAGGTSTIQRVTDTRGVTAVTTYDLCLHPVGTSSVSYGTRTIKNMQISQGGFRLGGSKD